ncbi:DUF2087 domain-containing protein [Phenylobacterium aquaticum]|uniref:DUF2087 domain-containing protein n=1 Tax=Phenylobacterium aquaticum TaxID=1763816 RepID=UPI0026F0600E|nr:DUF2087 domain-containing protein [Phenylobacterium aquaticum]
MSKVVFPLVAKDVSAFARALGRELETSDAKPGHVQLLNMLSRSAGYQNFQHFRAQAQAQGRLEREPEPTDPVDHVLVERLARTFDEAGRLMRWPSKTGHQHLCLWALWARIPAEQVFVERQINELLKAAHLFGDHALLRRELVNYQMVSRTLDCRDYRRIEQRPPAEAIALIRHLEPRLKN